MESFIHLFETAPGNGTETPCASMPESLPPEVNKMFNSCLALQFLVQFLPRKNYCWDLSSFAFFVILQVEEGNVEYKVS